MFLCWHGLQAETLRELIKWLNNTFDLRKVCLIKLNILVWFAQNQSHICDCAKDSLLILTTCKWCVVVRRFIEESSFAPYLQNLRNYFVIVSRGLMWNSNLLKSSFVCRFWICLTLKHTLFLINCKKFKMHFFFREKLS